MPSPSAETPQSSSAPTARRRGFFAGLGALGAVGVLAGLASRREPEAVAEAAPAAEPPERGGGYQLSAHVKRYYETTRV